VPVYYDDGATIDDARFFPEKRDRTIRFPAIIVSTYIRILLIRNGEVAKMDIAQSIHEIETQVGRLSPMQKFLLGTDGSVTQILEAITGKPVVIETREQKITAADPAIAKRLGIQAGDPVNYRVVEIKTLANGEVLIYAISHTPVARLSPEFKDDLMKADIPIGKIIQNHRIEARREILDAWVSPASAEAGRIFSLCSHEPLLSRQYRIIHNGEPLIFIQEQFPYNRFLEERRVIVRTPSRLHITLIDMHGGSGRVDGGVGIALDEPGILIEVRQSLLLEVLGCDSVTQERIMDTAQGVLKALHAGGNVSITVRKHYPPHTGLGSGSQLMLAVARGIAEIYGRSCTVQEIALMVGRGGTSGIGTAAFEQGGFIVDGGHTFGYSGEKSEFRPSAASRGVRPPPVIARHDFPKDWKILLAMPNLPAGASGRQELDIFRTRCPVPIEEVRELCHEILMRMLPGIVEKDLDLFSSSVDAIQGLGFKKVELSLQPQQIPGLMERLRSAGAACAGMSSFGPAVYAIGDTDMRGIEQAARSYMDEHAGGTTLITSARNTGAQVRVA
jgi:beta-ribofuranosylaminobenzene 5'-phosphate synthase